MRCLTAVLEDCERRGIHLGSVNGDGLEVRGSLAPKLREELSHHKQNILRVVRVGECIHERKPEECKVCNGYVRRLIEQEEEVPSENRGGARSPGRRLTDEEVQKAKRFIREGADPEEARAEVLSEEGGTEP